MTPVVVGLDIGGTKTALMVERIDGARLVELELPSGDWSATPVDGAARWIENPGACRRTPGLRDRGAWAPGPRVATRTSIATGWPRHS